MSFVDPLLHLIRNRAGKGRLVKMPEAAIMEYFQSLGDNCEFGLVQRHFGAEPLGLFKFAHTTSIDGLIAAFDARFAAFELPENIRVTHFQFPNGGTDFISSVSAYHFNSHAAPQPENISEEEVRLKEIKRLNLLARTLMEDAEAAETIFVYKSNEPPVEQKIVELHRALGRYGPNWLFWVTPETHDWPAGRVGEVAERLICGSIDRFAPYERAYEFSLEGWRTICIKAYDLWNARRG